MAHAADPSAVLPDSPTAWSHAAERDVAAAYQMMVDNHPGMVDPGNPGFPAQLEKARDAGLALAARVSDAPGYAAAFQRFGALMNDGHATAFADLPADLMPKTRWPGFVAVWRGDGLYVFASKVDAIPKGAKVLGCDGVGIRTLIRRNVFEWYGREKIDGLWWARARRVFYDDGNPFITRPNTCTFAVSGRRVRNTLEWRDGDAEFELWREASYNGDELPIGRTEPRPGLVWIAMPNFGPDAAGVAAYRSLVQSLKETRPELMLARAIVLDLRQNQGGSSQWSREIAGALWGDARVERRLNALFARVEIWFRANEATANHVESLATRFENQGSPEDAQEARAVVASIRAAMAAGRPLALNPGTQPQDPPPATAADPRADLPTDPTPLAPPVYVIVPGQCASACNDALDTFTRFDGVKLVGAPSSNDSYYMEVRVQSVPSGLARVVLPTKIWMHRPRGPMDIFRPDIVNSSLAWTTDTFADLIESDLKRSGR